MMMVMIQESSYKFLHVSSRTRVCSMLIVMIMMMAVDISHARISLPANETIPAVIAFGDSIADTGNNNGLITAVKCNFPPYGRNFDGGKPTGRFCDGKVPTDLLAEELGIKQTVPAYLDPDLQLEDMVTGVSFASGGSGYDPLTPTIVSVISLSDQLKFFKEYIEKLKAHIGEEKTNTTISKSLFLIVAGSNDIANTYFVTGARKLQYDVAAYTTLMASSASAFFKGLYELGARRIAVFSAPPVGCVPFQRTVAGGLVHCAEDYNRAARLFNSKLSLVLDSLNTQLPNSKMVYIDIYNPAIDLIQNPQKYGFTHVNNGCCGMGLVEVAILCNPLVPSTCSNVSDYVFWDSYHPTERAYKTLIVPLINKYINRFF